MEVFAIPVEDKFILYRPLLRLAFIGNQAMADLALNLAKPETAGAPAPEAALSFLEAVGFLRPDPPTPPLPAHSYCPTSVVLLLTNRCNLRCTYCYAAAGEAPRQELSPALAQTVIDRVCQNAVEQGQPHFELTFHGGGEPLQAWETLREAAAYARRKPLPCRLGLVSNGVWTTRQRDWVIHNLNSLSLSFDGRLSTQDRQRPFVSGRGSFQAVMRSLAALDQAGFSYGIRMTATAPWRGQLAEDVRFICEATGCRGMQVEPAFNTRRGEHQGPTQAEGLAFVEAFKEAFEVARRAGRQLTYSGARPWLIASTFCTAPYGALIVNAAGDLVACYEIASQDHPLARMSTVGRIVDSRVQVDTSNREALITYLEDRRARCRECFCYWHCAGDCYTRAFFAAPKTAEGTSPRCAMNREITAHLLLWHIMAGEGVWQGQELPAPEMYLDQMF